MIRTSLPDSIVQLAKPDFGMPGWGIYDHYTYIDAQGHEQRRDYSSRDTESSECGARTFRWPSPSTWPTTWMKSEADKDSTGVRKISFIENLSLSQSYNFAA